MSFHGSEKYEEEEYLDEKYENLTKFSPNLDYDADDDDTEYDDSWLDDGLDPELDDIEPMK